MTRYSAIVLMLFFAAGCDLLGSGNELTFTTDREAYESGQVVGVEVRNDLQDSVGLNLCFGYLNLEVQISTNEWEATSAYGGEIPNVACTAILNSVAPGRSQFGVFHLPQNQPAGTYRFSTNLEVHGEKVVAQTNTFVIR